MIVRVRHAHYNDHVRCRVFTSNWPGVSWAEAGTLWFSSADWAALGVLLEHTSWAEVVADDENVVDLHEHRTSKSRPRFGFWGRLRRRGGP